MTEKFSFSKIDHIGVIVKDLEKAVEHYESLGFGPFEPLRIARDGAYKERRVLDKPIRPDSIKLKVSVAKIGPVKLELIQPAGGESLWKEFLDTKGEGINHLGFYVDDIDKEESELVEKGLKVLYKARFSAGGGGTYFETRGVGGFIMELIQWPPE